MRFANNIIFVYYIFINFTKLLQVDAAGEISVPPGGFTNAALIFTHITQFHCKNASAYYFNRVSI